MDELKKGNERFRTGKMASRNYLAEKRSPQAGRIQITITSGVVSMDTVTFSGQQQFPLGDSAELTVHGTVKGGLLNGTMDMTSRGVFGTVTNSGPITLSKQ